MAVSRRKFLASVGETDTLLLPSISPTPTAGLVTADGDRFNYRFKPRLEGFRLRLSRRALH